MENESERGDCTEMTRAAKITYLLALLLGFSVGAYVKFHVTMTPLESYFEMIRSTAPGVLDDFSYVQYKHADTEHARAALQSYADLLEEMQKWNPDRFRPGTLSVTYVRLALIEDAADNPELSHVYMTKARYWNTANGGPDRSESEMKNAVEKADELFHAIVSELSRLARLL